MNMSVGGGADREASEFSPPTLRQEGSELCTPYSVQYRIYKLHSQNLHIINLRKVVFPQDGY